MITDTIASGHGSPQTDYLQADKDHRMRFMDDSTYRQLSRIAAWMLHRERRRHLLEPADIVHDAISQLIRAPGQMHLCNQKHFVAIALRAMHRILIDKARAERAQKANWGSRVDLDPERLYDTEDLTLRIAWNEALQGLAEAKTRGHEVVILHSFVGLSLVEIAKLLAVSTRTVKRDLKRARNRRADRERERPSEFHSGDTTSK
jgi:RNA polymerase sigma factor (TIGR02999 family)